MVVSRPALWLVMAGVGVLLYLSIPGAVADLAAETFTDLHSALFARAPRGPEESHVLVVALDDQTRQAHDDRWPLPPSVLAKAIQELKSRKAAAIGLEPRVDGPSPTDPGGEKQLAAAIKAAGNVVLRDTRFGPRTVSWLPALSAVAAARGSVRFHSGAHGVVRGVALDGDGYLLELAKRHRPGGEARVERGTLVLSGVGSRPLSFGLADGVGLLFRPPRPGELPVVSCAALVAGKVPAESIEGRTVLIGATAMDLARPVALPGNAVSPEVLVEAAAVDAVLTGRALHVPPAAVPLFGFLFLLGLMAAMGSFGPLWTALAALVAALAAQLAWSAAMLSQGSTRPDPLPSLAGLAAAGVVLVLARGWEAFVLSGRFAALAGGTAAVLAEDMYRRALELIRAGKHPQAIDLLQQVMRADPARRAQATVQILICYLTQHEFELIEDTFKQIAPDQLSLADSYDLGLKLTEAGYFEEARALFAMVYNRDVNFRDVKHQLEVVVQAQASRKDVMERLIIKELRKDYKNLEMVRRGGMAIIYRGYDSTVDRVVAVKILTPHLNDDENVVKRFFLEAETMKDFDHPNIVKVYRIHKEGQLRYYAMESVHPAETLYDLIQKDVKLEVPRAIAILKQVCIALEYAHARQIIHRDIKPQNILIAPGDVVKLIDFGIARFEALSTMTSTGVVMGTPRYMSPEQLKGERVDERTDIYACGVTFFEMLTGILGSENPMMEKVKGRTSIYQLILRQNLPTPLVRMVLKCLEGDRTKRYSSALQLRQDLDEYERLPATALEL
jgi:CHASE2 domain-containing sensor protein/tRNA A-37 threonylcarbamoyl transferase component Bud32